VSKITSGHVIYFCHGIPGSEHDASLLAGLPEHINIIAPNLLDHKSNENTLLDQLVFQFDNLTANYAAKKIHVVGFSIGCMAAIKIAAERSSRVAGMTLVSPAAPLALGDFLPHMAGRTVFALARRSTLVLRFITAVQCLLFRISPVLMLKLLFSTCGKIEKALLAKANFRDALYAGFRNSFCVYPDEYQAFLKSYVLDWSACLHDVRCPVQIWHGSDDTWSPIEMSYSLRSVLPAKTVLCEIHGAEHYSTLTHVFIQSRLPDGQRS